MSPLPELLTVQQVAEWGKVTVKTVWRWLEEGKKFPNAVKLGGGWRIPTTDLENLMKTRDNGPALPAKPPQPAPATGKAAQRLARSRFLDR